MDKSELWRKKWQHVSLLGQSSQSRLVYTLVPTSCSRGCCVADPECHHFSPRFVADLENSYFFLIFTPLQEIWFELLSAINVLCLCLSQHHSRPPPLLRVWLKMFPFCHKLKSYLLNWSGATLCRNSGSSLKVNLLAFSGFDRFWLVLYGNAPLRLGL